MGMSAGDLARIKREVDKAAGMIELPTMWVREMIMENEHLTKEMEKWHAKWCDSQESVRALEAETARLTKEWAEVAARAEKAERSLNEAEGRIKLLKALGGREI